jgi:hypothetical protein
MHPIPAHEQDRAAQAAIEAASWQRPGPVLSFEKGKGRPVPQNERSAS